MPEINITSITPSWLATSLPFIIAAALTLIVILTTAYLVRKELKREKDE
ncbi:MAG: hypothetical protein K6G36_03055 [Candidatus Saccharibacteria bacterium]|nr:hypothetical protein [Candidatus Saccharibacteria bacterium]